MAFKALQTRQTASSIFARRGSVVCTCNKVSSSGSSSVLQRLPQQLATAALTASLLMSPVGVAEAAKAQQLADLLRDDVSALVNFAVLLAVCRSAADGSTAFCLHHLYSCAWSR
jgi:hypothetical protein